MSPARTDSELVGAVEAMYRIRAVESPPDAKGQRTIWHRASKNAELVSWVDAEGRVVRQEMMLFDDVVVWERGQRLKTGTVTPNGSTRAHKPSDSMTMDAKVEQERVSRMVRGLASYAGDDRFITHVRELIKPPAVPTDVGEQITRPSHQVISALADAQTTEPPKRVAVPTGAMVIGLVLVLISLALIFLR